MACTDRKAETMKKQGQITIIIITGIALLFAFGLVIWLGSRTADLRETEAEQQRLRQVARQPVQEYVQQCLDVTTQKMLILLTTQGGVLYKSQGGLTQDVLPQEEGERFVNYQNTNVSYLIMPPEGTIGRLHFSQQPEYPFTTFPYVFRSNDPGTKEILQFQDTGYFGISRLPPLLRPGEASLQEQLESAIAYQLPGCTNWSEMERQGIKVTAGRPNISIMTAENLSQAETEKFLTVSAKWQVNATDQTTGSTTTTDEFSLNYPVHLARFYLFTKSLADKETSNASFDPASLSTQATPVQVIRNAYTHADGSTDDIIIVRDTESALKGKPVEFWILRKNRMPAIVWINQTDLDNYKFIPTGLCNIDSDNILLSGNRLLIKFGLPEDWSAELKAIDPDEEPVAFRTEPKAPARIRVQHSGQDFSLYVYASDNGEKEDFQILQLHTADCPTP
jgi:hypothetical protein